MNPFSLGLLFSVITTFGLASWILYVQRHSRMHCIFALYLFSIGFWAAFSAVQTLSANPHVVSVAVRVMHWGAIFISVFYLHFLYHLTGKIPRWFLILCYAISGMFLILNHTPLFVLGIQPKKPFHYFMIAGPVYPLYILFFLLTWSFAVVHLWFESRKADGQKKRQLKLLFIGSLIGYLGGSGAFLPVYDLKLPPLYPYGNFAIAIYVSIMTYAIIKHRFLEIEVIVKRTLVFAGLLMFVFGVFSFGLFLGQEILARFLEFRREYAMMISIFLTVLGYEPMRKFLIETTDRYLFQKKYDYQKILKDASRGMAQIESLNHLLGLVTHFITLRMRLKNAAVLVRDLKTDEFHLVHLRGYPRHFVLPETLSSRNALIHFLDHEKEAVDIEQVKEYLQTGAKADPQNKRLPSYDFERIKFEMNSLRASCSVPSFLGRELRSVLILGEKKSGDYYSKQDLDVLFTLAQESAIAIENARLYDEALKRTSDLQKINQELEVARNRLALALEETERANQELQNTQAQLIHEQKMATLGRLAASVGHEVNNPLTILSMNVSRALLKYRKEPDLKVAEILELFQKMEQNIGRIKAVVNTLTGLLKKSEKGKFEPLSLKLILEETLPLVQFQTYLENPSDTDVEFDIPGSIPLIRGDLERLQEVFLNLFINAFHAMTGKRKRKIIVTACLDENAPRMVAVDFVDNGCGMTEEIQKKIFTYGFTTKGPARGSGMGLYMCKYIIELHGGQIKVKSQPGAGTTFSLTLPIYEDPTSSSLSGGVGTPLEQKQ